MTDSKQISKINKGFLNTGYVPSGMDKESFRSVINDIQSPDKNNLITTRTDNKAHSWDKGLSEGLGEDGGLFLPKEFSKLPEVFFDNLDKLSMPQIAFSVIRTLIPREAIDDETLINITKKALSWGIPIEEITGAFAEDGEDLGRVFVSWLDRGPTGSFKDFAGQIIAPLFDWWCEQNQTPKNILVATSGDTGVAIAEAFGGMKWITVTVLYPADGVAAPQEAQMQYVDQKYDNVQCLPSDGPFDDQQARSKILQKARLPEDSTENSSTREERAQVLLNQLERQITENVTLPDAKKIVEIIEKLELSSANSINLWRLVPQMVQYFNSYAELVRQGVIRNGDEIVFAIPTGNAGHITAGLFARELGLRIKKFILATNKNDILHNLLNEGILQQDEFFGDEESNSMNIQKPSNLERMFALARQFGDPDAQVDMAGLVHALEDKKQIKKGIDPKDFGVTDKMLQWLRDGIVSAETTNESVAQLIKKVQDKTNTTLEWHGGAGVDAVSQVLDKTFEGVPIVVFETAAVAKAKPGSLKEKADIEQIPEKYEHPEMEQAIEMVKSKALATLEYAQEEIALEDAVQLARGEVYTSTFDIVKKMQTLAELSKEQRED